MNMSPLVHSPLYHLLNSTFAYFSIAIESSQNLLSMAPQGQEFAQNSLHLCGGYLIP